MENKQFVPVQQPETKQSDMLSAWTGDIFKKKAVVVGGLLIFLIIIGVSIVFMLKSFYKSTEKDEPAVMTIDDRIKANKQARLADVSGADSFGEAYISRIGNTMNHTILASLPTLQEGFSYQGWLLNEATGENVSTGVLVPGEKGIYITSFSSETSSYDGYNMVVVTLEKMIDDIPEKHILEGVLK